ncbi:MAG: 50S ribosomal protein L23 [Patescibacteria group bacterium]
MSKLGKQTIKTELRLIKPRITEKSVGLAESVTAPAPIYTFDVPMEVNKIEISEAFFKKYKINPTKVNIVKNSPRWEKIRGRRGRRSGYKKAMIYVPVGQKIDFI